MFRALGFLWRASEDEEAEEEAEQRALEEEEGEEAGASTLGASLLDEHSRAYRRSSNELGSDGRMSSGSTDEEFELLVQAYMHDVHYTSRPQAISNLCYATLNAGLVALPYAAYQAGLPLFMLAVVLLAVVSGYSTCMVIAMAEDRSAGPDDHSFNNFQDRQSMLLSYSRLGREGLGLKPLARAIRTLEDLCELAFGAPGYYCVSLFQVLLSLVLMSLSLQIWTEVVHSVLGGRLATLAWVQEGRFPAASFLLTTNTGAALLGSWVVLPFILRSASMSSLRWTAYATVLVVAAGLLSVVYAFSVDRMSDGRDASIRVSDIASPKGQWWAICFVATLCFSYNQKAFSVYACLRRRSTKRWQFVVKRSTGLMVFLYLVFGVFGYLSHLQENDRLNRFNFFLDFDQSASPGSVFFDATRAVVACSLLLTIPVDSLVAATTLRRVLHRLRIRSRLRRSRLRCWLWLEQALPTCHACLSSCLKGVGGLSPCLLCCPCCASSLSESFDRPSAHQHQHQHQGRSDSDVKQAAAAVAATSHTLPAPVSPPRFVQPNNPSLCDSRGSHPSRSSRTEASDNDASDTATPERHPSVADIMDRLPPPGCSCWFPEHVLPALLFWGASLAFCCLIENWVVLAACFGSVSTSVLVLVLPSMLYFRLGLSSDFRAAPLLRGLDVIPIPNRAYMLAVQLLGVALLAGNLLCGLYVTLVQEDPINDIAL